MAYVPTEMGVMKKLFISLSGLGICCCVPAVSGCGAQGPFSCCGVAGSVHTGFVVQL